MKKTVVLGLLAALLLAGSAMGFDGRRKGFVIGGGLGLSPHVTTTGVKARRGLAINPLVGYGWNQFNMVVYEGNTVTYDSDVPHTQGFHGVTWYHYFGNGMKGAFTAVGLGAYILVPWDRAANDASGGMLLGVGYQFSPHWQVGGFFSFGKTSRVTRFSPESVDYDHTHVSILVGTMAF